MDYIERRKKRLRKQKIADIEYILMKSLKSIINSVPDFITMAFMFVFVFVVLPALF